jgi:hypothetical protein
MIQPVALGLMVFQISMHSRLIRSEALHLVVVEMKTPVIGH